MLAGFTISASYLGKVLEGHHPSFKNPAIADFSRDNAK